MDTLHHEHDEAPVAAPTTPAAIDLRQRWADALTFAEFVAHTRSQEVFWYDMARRARVPMDAVARGWALTAPRRLLVLLEDWCGDAMNTIPVLAALADQVPQLELRVLERDRNLDLMDQHLSDGARAIPVVMVLDGQWQERGWWGSRPAALKAWATSADARALSPEERYREIRRWYARDRGLTTLDEVLTLIERSTDAASRAA